MNYENKHRIESQSHCSSKVSNEGLGGSERLYWQSIA